MAEGAATAGDAVSRLCTRDPGCGVEDFAETRGDELDAAELEPGVEAASSAVAIPDDTVSAIPTPAVTAPA